MKVEKEDIVQIEDQEPAEEEAEEEYSIDDYCD